MMTETEKQGLLKDILKLKKERQAVILAHNYQRGELQDLADFTGDSLGLTQQAAKTDAKVIVFCGVHFMAETAAIMNPDKIVVIPDKEAGCSLAAMISGESLRRWKAEHPNAVVVSYINCTADVKAESDYICTSTNARIPFRARSKSAIISRSSKDDFSAVACNSIKRPAPVMTTFISTSARESSS